MILTTNTALCNKNPDDVDLMIIPNPTSGILKILSESINTVTLDELPFGIYVVRFSTEIGEFQRKSSKNKY